MIAFLGDVALIADDLQSKYKPANPYIFNLEYVVNCNNSDFVPALGKINLSSANYSFENVFGTLPVAVNVANNHIYDYGEKGFISTVSKTKDLGIVNISDEPVFINDKLCLFSYMLFKDNKVFQFTYEKAKESISKVREANPDVRIVVQMHWGIENSPVESKEQKEVGHWLIDNGVDLVIGHHPHCLQPAEVYKGKFIFYSLGNALFANINTPSHYDKSYVSQRIYRFRWQYWNRKSIAVNYDEITNTVASVDCLYQKRNKLICKKYNVPTSCFLKKKNRFNNLRFKLRKYYLFLISNLFVDGKLFDLSALRHELRGK